MLIGVPKEIKNNEYRVGLTPPGVSELIHHKHTILIEKNAGLAVGFDDSAYRKAGAEIVSCATEIFDRAEMIVKVKEPQTSECALLKKNQLLFTYLHLVADSMLTDSLLKSGCVALAYETVSDPAGHLPLLTPMSEVAGRVSIQAGMYCLEKIQRGAGILLSGVPGVEPGKVLILGGGVVGENALRIAIGVGGNVTVVDRSLPRLQELDALYGFRLKTRYSNSETIRELIGEADLVVGSALIPGAAAPKLVTRDMLYLMRKGSVLVDVAIDQGGCFETSKPTTHQKPTYEIDGIIHYCVSNIPGAVPKTSTLSLTNATLPFVVELANKGWKQACAHNVHLRQGLNIVQGNTVYKAVAESLDIPYTPVETVLR